MCDKMVTRALQCEIMSCKEYGDKLVRCRFLVDIDSIDHMKLTVCPIPKELIMAHIKEVYIE